MKKNFDTDIIATIKPSMTGFVVEFSFYTVSIATKHALNIACLKRVFGTII